MKCIGIKRKFTLFLLLVGLHVGYRSGVAVASGFSDTVPLIGGREEVAKKLGFVGRFFSYIGRIPIINRLLGNCLNMFGLMIDAAGDEVGGETDEAFNAVGYGLREAGRKLLSKTPGSSTSTADSTNDGEGDEEEEENDYGEEKEE
ncbi:MAG: hypothetical protein LBB24_03630 [Rickettsiales bacterium]|jgi:hypothetical protein|nr:hypothetical protein [Rickettsiales bacterium]